jgi:hypothetical protein
VDLLLFGGMKNEVCSMTKEKSPSIILVVASMFVVAILISIMVMR